MLFKIFGQEIDSTLLVFVLTVIGGFAWWLFSLWIKSKIYNKIDELHEEILHNRGTTELAALETKRELLVQIETKRKESHDEHVTTRMALELQMKTNEADHQRGLLAISNSLNSHAADDTKTFTHLSSTLSTIQGDLREVATFVQLIRSGELQIPNKK